MYQRCKFESRWGTTVCLHNNLILTLQVMKAESITTNIPMISYVSYIHVHVYPILRILTNVSDMLIIFIFASIFKQMHVYKLEYLTSTIFSTYKYLKCQLPIYRWKPTFCLVVGRLNIPIMMVKLLNVQTCLKLLLRVC